MPSSEEKKRRRRLVKALTEQKRAREEAAMPLSRQDLRALLAHLEATIFRQAADGTTLCLCDETLARTRAFLRERRLPEETVVAWLHGYGGYCDCEVTANVGDAWEV